jgi:hypothetical protein
VGLKLASNRITTLFGRRPFHLVRFSPSHDEIYSEKHRACHFDFRGSRMSFPQYPAFLSSRGGLKSCAALVKIDLYSWVWRRLWMGGGDATSTIAPIMIAVMNPVYMVDNLAHRCICTFTDRKSMRVSDRHKLWQHSPSALHRALDRSASSLPPFTSHAPP